MQRISPFAHLCTYLNCTFISLALLIYLEGLTEINEKIMLICSPAKSLEEQIISVGWLIANELETTDIIIWFTVASYWQHINLTTKKSFSVDNHLKHTSK